jgi:hypothetical protein
MRQIYQKIGFIVIINVALVNLLLAIIGFMREPTTINNYYNEPEQIDYSVPLEVVTFYNLSMY